MLINYPLFPQLILVKSFFIYNFLGMSAVVLSHSHGVSLSRATYSVVSTTVSAFDNPLTAMCRWSLTVTMMSYSGSETLKCLNQATNNGLRQDQLFDNPFALCLIF